MYWFMCLLGMLKYLILCSLSLSSICCSMFDIGDVDNLPISRSRNAKLNKRSASKKRKAGLHFGPDAELIDFACPIYRERDN